MKHWKRLYNNSGTFTCYYCLKEFPINLATRDHKLPRSRNGQTTPENIVICCQKCNSEKGALTEEEYKVWKRLNYIRCGGLTR